jgi:hypothetical protein
MQERNEGFRGGWGALQAYNQGESGYVGLDKVGSMEGLWLVQEDSGEGERVLLDALVGWEQRVRLQHTI